MKSMHLQLTNNCNLECAHCYCEAAPGNPTMPIGVNAVITKDNQDDIYGLGKLAKDLGASIFTVAPIIPNQSCLEDHLSGSLSPEETMQMLWQLHAVKEDFAMEVSLQRVIPYCFFWDKEELRFLANRSCGAASYSVNVQPEGEVTGCIALNQSYGNILTDSLESIWINVREKTVEEECQGCDVLTQCGGGCEAENLAYAEGTPFDRKPIKLDEISPIKLKAGEVLLPNFDTFRYRKEEGDNYLVMQNNGKHHLVSSTMLDFMRLLTERQGIQVNQDLLNNQAIRHNLEDMLTRGVLKVKEA